MKQFLLLPFLSFAVFSPVNHDRFSKAHTQPAVQPESRINFNDLSFGSQAEPGTQKMSAAVFKSQQYCRAELKDFEFDAQFNIVSAAVYFSGTNFKTAAKGNISSSSLKPISTLMERCSPGTFVIFDEVKVVGPDKLIRTIPGISLMLY